MVFVVLFVLVLGVVRVDASGRVLWNDGQIVRAGDEGQRGEIKGKQEKPVVHC